MTARTDLKIAIASEAPARADTAVVLIWAESRMGPAAARLDKTCGGLLASQLKAQKTFHGKAGQTLTLTPPQKSEYTRIVLLGMGDADKIDHTTAETTGGKLCAALTAAGAESAVLFLDTVKGLKIGEDGLGAHIAMGAKLRSYNFDKYKTAKKSKKAEKAPQLENLTLVAAKTAPLKSAWKSLEIAAQGVFLTRDLINEPPNNLYPDSFVKIVSAELKPLGIEIEVMDEKKMKQLGFHAHLAVGMGSSRPPRVMIMRWNGANKGAAKKGKEGPLAFVGKGVTFDTGGVNLKPTGSMEDMKMDMGGAGAVAGAMKILALRKAKIDVVGIAGLAENSVSGTAYRPSDVIDSVSGQTIEVMNTDAEGRLVLCDALAYVQKTYKPRLIVDLATLTGAMVVALGSEYCGIFANDDNLWKNIEKAGAATGEKIWRMPLDEAFSKELDSHIADLKSTGNGRWGGACTAAAFLERFIEKGMPWAHMDIAGVAWITANRPTAPKPAVGYGVRLLDALAAGYEK